MSSLIGKTIENLIFSENKVYGGQVISLVTTDGAKYDIVAQSDSEYHGADVLIEEVPND